MKKLLALIAMALPFAFAVSASNTAQDGGGAANPPPADAGKTELFAVVKTIDGPPDEVLVQLPDASEPAIAVAARYPQGTKITTGDATVIVGIEGTLEGKAVQNSMISIRHTTETVIETALIDNSSSSVVTRMKVATGEVRVKVTDESPDYSTDMKVSTPNATASVRGTDVHAIGFSANFGTVMVVASGSISAQRANGTTVGCGAGSDVNDSAMSALESAMTKGEILVPLGSTEFEVGASQLVSGGPESAGSDTNNPLTNSTLGATGASSSSLSGFAANHDSSQPPPVKSGRSQSGNRR
ncbi:MAG: FecR domain-containing protein [Planctomycetes bacterium]|nr:FecR domain-containing protein [Planctomycetota bacterium]NUQ34470.1 FecR domain-containing protein [Planctomycetaceae bacterium]